MLWDPAFERTRKYEVVDPDPVFGKVIRYFRIHDYALIVGGALAQVGMTRFYFFRKVGKPGRFTKEFAQKSFQSVLYPNIAIGAGIGFFAAFMFSYARLTGQIPNQREVKKDRYEIKTRLAKGLPAYPTSSLPVPTQQVSAHMSYNHGGLIAVFFPWFNFVNHPYHYHDLSRYYEVRPGEENWPKPLSIEKN